MGAVVMKRANWQGLSEGQAIQVQEMLNLSGVRNYLAEFDGRRTVHALRIPAGIKANVDAFLSSGQDAPVTDGGIEPDDSGDPKSRANDVEHGPDADGTGEAPPGEDFAATDEDGEDARERANGDQGVRDDLTVKEAVPLIRKMVSVESLKLWREVDARKGVQEAIDARLAELRGD